MTKSQWTAFCTFRDEVRSLCKEWVGLEQKLFPLQKEASKKDTPPYPLETAVVYNTAWDAVTQEDQISLIVIGDNPGKEEQLTKNRKYLVGQSGRIAEGFFKRNPEFGIDFRKNAIIVNKTPVHTAKTAHLKYLSKNGDSCIKDLLLTSQLQMARLTATLHQSLFMGTEEGQKPQLWLVGYAELKDKGIFTPYRDCLREQYKTGAAPASWEQVFVFQHFSMNRFLVDLSKAKEQSPEQTTVSLVKQIGTRHKNEIFGL